MGIDVKIGPKKYVAGEGELALRPLTKPEQRALARIVIGHHDELAADRLRIVHDTTGTGLHGALQSSAGKELTSELEVCRSIYTQLLEALT